MQFVDGEFSSILSSWNVLTKTHDYALASWNEIFAVVWRGATTLEAVRDLNQMVPNFAQLYPKGIGMLTIISEKAPPPPGAVRRALADVLTKGSTYIRCSAVIMEGTGFRAAAVRSIVTGLTLLAKHEFPHRICDVDGAVEMYSNILSRCTGRALDASAVRAAINHLRQQMLQ